MTKNRIRTAGPVIALAVLALVVRLFRLDWRGLWIDEAYAALLATGSVGDLFSLLRTDSGPPLYYILLKVWVAMFGGGEGMLRAPSVLAGVGAVVLAALVGRRLRFGAAGTLTGGALAVAPLLVFHGQDARYYAFLPLAAMGALLALLHLWRRGGWVAYGLVLAAAMYLHNYGLFIIPAAYAASLVWRHGVRWRSLHLAHALATILYAAWLPTLIAQLDYGGTAWAARFFGPTALLDTIEAFIPGGALPPYIAIPSSPTQRALAFGLAGLTLVMFVVGVARRGREDVDGRVELVDQAAPRVPFARRVSAVFAFGAVLLVVPYAVSLLGSAIYVPARTDVLAFGPLALAVAAGISRWPRFVWLGYACAYGALAAWALWGYVGLDLKSGDRNVSRFVAERARNASVVVAADLSYASITYYLGRWSTPMTVVPFPADMARHPGNVHRQPLLEDPEAALGAFQRALERDVAAGDAFLVVVPPNRLGTMLRRYLDAVAIRDPAAPLGQFRMGVLGTPLDVVGYRVPERLGR
jgi:hypothetical protein